MLKTRVQQYVERYGDRMMRFNAYAVKKTGLQQSQTLLQLDDYMLICSPFQLSMKRAIVLIILSRDEVSFFQKFQKSLCRLSFTFLKPGTKIPISFFVRATLERIGAVKGRQNVCMAELSYKACPNDLVQIIGDYLTTHAVLKALFARLKDRSVPVDARFVQMMRCNPVADAQFGQLRLKVQILSLAANRIECLLPARLPGLVIGSQFTARLFFGDEGVSLPLTVTMVGEDDGEGHRKASCSIEFQPELVEILNDYFQRKSTAKPGH